MHHSTTELKYTSNEWGKKREPGPVKETSRLSAGKVMATVSFLTAGPVEHCFFFAETLE